MCLFFLPLVHKGNLFKIAAVYIRKEILLHHLHL